MIFDVVLPDISAILSHIAEGVVEIPRVSSPGALVRVMEWQSLRVRWGNVVNRGRHLSDNESPESPVKVLICLADPLFHEFR